MGSHRVTCSAFALGVSLIVRSASAQPAPPEAKPPAPPEAGQGKASLPAVVPPRLVHDPGVSYPKSALKQGMHERVEVQLILELNAAGVVVNAQLEQESPAAFAEEALRAAESLQFEPALRDGVPVPARIRFRYDFAPPPAALGGRVIDSQTGQALVGARILVQVAQGEHRLTTGADGSWISGDLPSGSATLRVETEDHVAQEIAVQLTPGEETKVVFRLESSREIPSAAETAGAPPIEVVVRGEPVAPAIASFSREEVRRIPGAFGDPFRAVETLPGVTPVASGLPYFYIRGAPPGNAGYFVDGVRVPYLYHIGFGPSVVHPGLVERVDLHPGGYPARFGRSAGGVVSATTSEPEPWLHGEANLRLFDLGALVESGFADGRGSAMVGGRYSYTAALLSLVAPEVRLDYRDYQARISYDLTPNDRISVFGFGAYDLLGQVKNGIEELLYGTEFYRADLRYDARLDGGRMRTAVTFGYDRSSASFISGEHRFVIDRSIATRTDVLKHLGDQLTLRGGTDIAFDNYTVEEPLYADPDSPDSQSFDELFQTRSDLATGAWADLTIKLSETLEVTPGVRGDIYSSESENAVGIDPRLAARWELTPSLRLMPTLGIVHQPPSFAVPIPGLTPTLAGGLQRSFQSAMALEFDLAESATAGVAPFYNVYSNMTDALGTSTGEGQPDFVARSDGRAYGVELFLRRRLTERLGGFFTYTLSRSERNLAGVSFPSGFDRTHVMNAAVSYNLGKGYSAGGRFVFYSGAPVQQSARTLVERSDHVEREPPFFRLDLRAEKRWTLSETAWIAMVVEVMNATLSRESFAGEEVGPIVIPSIGAEMGF
jgi:TonB family protein